MSERERGSLTCQYPVNAVHCEMIWTGHVPFLVRTPKILTNNLYNKFVKLMYYLFQVFRERYFPGSAYSVS